MTFNPIPGSDNRALDRRAVACLPETETSEIVAPENVLLIACSAVATYPVPVLPDAAVCTLPIVYRESLLTLRFSLDAPP